MNSKTKFFIHTTGCKTNQWDSYVISNRLRKIGLTLSPMPRADVVIANACTLTEGAERDLRRFINRVRNINKGAQIILAGCHAQVYPDLAYGADLVLGQDEKFRIDEFLTKTGLFVNKTRSIPMEDMLIDNLPRGRTRVFLKIQDGCDQFCAYCIVPFARGTSRSRTSGEVIKAMQTFKEREVKEVVLTGIELSAYKDPVTGIDLKDLLRSLEQAETPPRIRISSIDPLCLDDEFIRIIASSAKITKSLHVPLQSGSNAILKRMGRRYTKEFIGDVVKKLNNTIPGFGIGMDVMVGFPTEDESQFMDTYRFLEDLDICYLHVFPFSARKGTRAAIMGDNVMDGVKKERASVLRRLDNGKRRSFYKRFIGQKACIVAEGKIYHNIYMRGYTDNYIPVYIPYKKSLENNLVDVTIKEMRGSIVIGEPIIDCLYTSDDIRR